LWAAGFGIREIEKGGDGEVGLRFVEDFFDMVAVGLGGAERFCVEWCFFGEAADKSQDFFADFALTGFGLDTGGNGGDGAAAGDGFFGGDIVEVVGELGAAGVVWANNFGLLQYDAWRERRWRGHLGGEESCGQESGARKETEGSHRDALIHRQRKRGQ